MSEQGDQKKEGDSCVSTHVLQAEAKAVPVSLCDIGVAGALSFVL